MTIKKRIIANLLIIFLLAPIANLFALDYVKMGLNLLERKDMFFSDLQNANVNNTPLRDNKFIGVDSNLFFDLITFGNFNIRFSPNKFIPSQFEKYKKAAKLTIAFGFFNNWAIPIAMKQVPDMPLSSASIKGTDIGVNLSRTHRRAEYFVGFTKYDFKLDVKLDTPIDFNGTSIGGLTIGVNPYSVDFGLKYKFSRNGAVVSRISYFPQWYKVNANISTEYKYFDAGFLFCIGEPVFVYPFVRLSLRF